MTNLLLFLFLAALVLVFVVGFFYGLYVLLFPTRTAGDRLRELQKVQEVDTYDIITVDSKSDSLVGDLGSRIGSLAAPTSEEDKNKQRLLLLQAGFKSRHALEIFNSVRVTMALCCPFLVLPFFSPDRIAQVSLGVVVAGAFGYYAPAMYISNVTEKRKKILLRIEDAYKIT